MFKTISDKILSVKQAYLAKAPLEKWDLIRKAGNIMLYFGCDILRLDYKVTALTFAPGIMTIDFVICVCYSLHFYRNEILIPLQSVTILGIIIPVCCV